MNEITITPFEIHLLASKVYEFINQQMKLNDEEVKLVLSNIIHTLEMCDNYNKIRK